MRNRLGRFLLGMAEGLLKKRFVTIGDLQIGGHCGCCGHWLEECIVEKDIGWTLCDVCGMKAKEVTK